jgi:ribosome-binding protein aMBF1 (putative translation factor)
MKFGRHVQHFRRVKGWSQGRLAQAINRSRSAVATWDSGQSVPDFFVGCEIAEALSITPGELHHGPSQFAMNVVVMRSANRMEASHLAIQLQLSANQMTRIERGIDDVPQDSDLAADIAAIFGCKTAVMYGPIDIR